MEGGLWVTLAALIISVAAMVLTALQIRIAVKKDYVTGLEHQIQAQALEIKDLKVRVEICERDRRELRSENHRLLNRIEALDRQLNPPHP